MPDETQFVIPHLSAPFSTILAATGVAIWARELARDVTGRDVDARIANRGDAVVVTLPVGLSPEQVKVKHYGRPPAYIRTARDNTSHSDLDVIDYEAERQHNADYYDRLKNVGKAVKVLSVDERNELEQMAPRHDWPVISAINQMGALAAYNKAVERWAACRSVYSDVAAIIWTMLSGKPDALDEVQKQWEQVATEHSLERSALLPAPQIVNPEQGKGANRAKADVLSIGGQESFWLLEYFKFVGLYHAGITRLVKDKKDRKTYVVVPARDGISLRWHQELYGEFQKQFWAASAVKMDVQAVLRYTATMLTQWQGAQISTGRRRRVSDFVDGFAVASYKDLGSAVAVMNVSMLRLPDWVDWPNEAEQAGKLVEVITEHQAVTNWLDEKKGEEEQLLRAYRDFLSSRDPLLRAFFDFMTGYAGHTIRKMNKREPVRLFTTDNLEVIIMANDERREAAGLSPLSKLVHAQGFRNIATAIRRSTVIPQFQKVKGDSPYDVRYGLADELRRKARNKGEFIAALSDFMQHYNLENKRVYAREKRAVRSDITTQDITEIVELIDEYDSPTVASLLIAFGYARDPKVPTEDSTSDDTTDQQDAATSNDDQASQD